MAINTLAIVTAVSLELVIGYKQFQDAVPNGNRVPHPCLDNYLWSGLGHRLSEGSGDRNPFGQDFDRNGRKWDRCLCERDSDGDGNTNGEELGDPECVWQPGDVPHRVDELTHPGVCEPLDSILCQSRNDWQFCDSKEFNCEAVEEPDVQEIRLQYPMTAVPPTETNYYCMTFDLPIDGNQSYHLIADRPILNNTLVIHHLIVFGCTGNDPAADSWKTPKPDLCGMGLDACPDMIALWGVGFSGACLPEEYGFRLGAGGYTTVMIQVHWNNPELRTDYTDAPGMSLFVTPHLRDNDAGIIMFGTTEIEIPARTDSYRVQGRCSSRCSRSLPHDINIDHVILHMHYLGVETGFSHMSEDGVLQHLVYEENYSYDSPKVYRFEQPLKFQPGDSMSISCTYQSTSTSETTHYGDGTSDEMCFGFATYYPRVPDWGICVNYRSIDWCPTTGYGVGCDIQGFLNETSVGPRLYAMYATLNAVCNKTGAGPDSCPPGCNEAAMKIRNNNPCLSGDTGHYMEKQIIRIYFGDLGTDLVRLLHTCDPDWSDGPGGYYDNDINRTKNRTSSLPLPAETEGCVFGKHPLGGAAVRHGVALSALILALVTYLR